MLRLSLMVPQLLPGSRASLLSPLLARFHLHVYTCQIHVQIVSDRIILLTVKDKSSKDSHRHEKFSQLKSLP